MRPALAATCALGALLVAGVAVAAAAYFGHGLHLQPTTAITGGHFDPKDLAPFNAGPAGRALWLLAILSVGYTTWLGMPLVLVGAGLLARSSTALAPSRRVAAWGVVAAVAAAWLFLRTPAAALFGVWLAD